VQEIFNIKMFHFFHFKHYLLCFKICTFSTFMNALAVKLSDYREVMSDSQTSTVAERFVNIQSRIFHQQCDQYV